jgi:hypothetical protein
VLLFGVRKASCSSCYLGTVASTKITGRGRKQDKILCQNKAMKVNSLETVERYNNSLRLYPLKKPDIIIHGELSSKGRRCELAAVLVSIGHIELIQHKRYGGAVVEISTMRTPIRASL